MNYITTTLISSITVLTFWFVAFQPTLEWYATPTIELITKNEPIMKIQGQPNLYVKNVVKAKPIEEVELVDSLKMVETAVQEVKYSIGVAENRIKSLTQKIAKAENADEKLIKETELEYWKKIRYVKSAEDINRLKDIYLSGQPLIKAAVRQWLRSENLDIALIDPEYID